MGKGKDEGGMMNDEFLVAHGDDFTGETVRVVEDSKNSKSQFRKTIGL